jgi:hypothetical protein
MREHTPNPETHPIVTHAFIDTDLRYAARELWQPANEPHHYTFARSASGRQLTANLPVSEHVQDAPQLTIAITDPSIRMHRAMRAIIGPYQFTSAVQFTVFEPQEAAYLKHKGVNFSLGINHEVVPDTQGTMTYIEFHQFMQQAGICERATAGQRLGRWVLDGINGWIDDEARLADGSDDRRPPMFGAW